MSVLMPPQRPPGALDPVRDRLSPWLPHTFRWARDRVRATVARMYLRQTGGPAESTPRSADRNKATPPPVAGSALSTGPAYDSGAAQSADPIPPGPVRQGAPCGVPMEPRGRPASRQVQFVLVVAANPSWGQAIAKNLEAQSYLVLTAGSVREASEKLI